MDCVASAKGTGVQRERQPQRAITAAKAAIPHEAATGTDVPPICTGSPTAARQTWNKATSVNTIAEAVA